MGEERQLLGMTMVARKEKGEVCTHSLLEIIWEGFPLPSATLWICYYDRDISSMGTSSIHFGRQENRRRAKEGGGEGREMCRRRFVFYFRWRFERFVRSFLGSKAGRKKLFFRVPVIIL